jgi:hypothetical protein
MLAFLFTLAACGGGGGGGFNPDNNSSSDGETYFLSMTLYDPSGNETRTVTSAAPGTLKVKVTRDDKSGKALEGVVVNTSSDIGLVFPASGTALSDVNGIAQFQIEAGLLKGAGTLTSTVDSPVGTVTETLSFQIGESGLRLGYFDEDGLFIENEIGIQPETLLASQGRAQLTVSILDEDGNLSNGLEQVRFNSGCLSSGQATLDPESPLTTGDGKVSATYSASGCSGTDEISASLVGATAQAFGSVTIAPPQATGLTFISADPRTIVLRGTGGGSDRRDSSEVVFQVVDSNGSPVQGVSVNFDLTTEVGGLKVSPASALSSNDGTVRATVFSGDVATVVRVIASTEANDGSGEQVSTVSDILTVSTGLPDQNSISVSVGGNFVVENGFTVDGTARTITVRMGDKFNNPVPNGTAAVFTTEYGLIDPSCETGIKNGERLSGTPTEGECSVLWTNQAPRQPLLEENREAVRTINDTAGYNCTAHRGNSGPCPNDIGYTRGGRSEILVTAIGEESFVDTNGNGIIDESERDLFDNVPEAFLDKNEDKVYTPKACANGTIKNSAQCQAGSEESFVDFNDNAEYDLNDDPAVYNGLLCPPEGDGNWCSRTLVNVRDSTRLILSADTSWDILVASTGGNVISNNSRILAGANYVAYISDSFNNPPGGGSTVTVEAGGDCEIIGEKSFTAPNTAAIGAFPVSIKAGGEGTTGTVTIKLTPTGGGTPYSETWNCEPFDPPDPNDPDSELGLGGDA